MSEARSVACVLGEHVILEVESIDRLYLNVYVPKLQHVLGVHGFFREQRGAKVVSSVLMEPITTAFVTSLEQFARQQGVPLIGFAKGQRKDEVTAGYLAQHSGQREWSTSARPRNGRPWCGPSGAMTRRLAHRMPGWSAPPPWSTSTTSMPWTTTSVPSF